MTRQTDGGQGIQFELSGVEARACGVSVGRLTIQSVPRTSATDILEAFNRSKFRIGILRAPASSVQLGAELEAAGAISWQADTLMVFERDLQSWSHDLTGFDLRVSVTSPSRRLVTSIFHGYRNHYSTNPYFEEVEPSDAYADWVASAAEDPGRRVFVAYRGDDEAGVCMTRNVAEDQFEVQLAGVVPGLRRKGVYRSMISEVARVMAGDHFNVMRISTQADNVGVMRAWCRMGFLPIDAINTFHLVRAWPE